MESVPPINPFLQPNGITMTSRQQGAQLQWKLAIGSRPRTQLPNRESVAVPASALTTYPWNHGHEILYKYYDNNHR